MYTNEDIMGAYHTTTSQFNGKTDVLLHGPVTGERTDGRTARSGSSYNARVLTATTRDARAFGV